MPGSTPAYGLPYLELDDPPDIAGGTQDLAEAVEAELVRLDAGEPAAQSSQGGYTNTTSTSYVVGSPVCGVSFVAPSTGRVLVMWSGYIDNTAAGGADTATTYLSIRVGTGSTIGGGSQVLAPSDDVSLANDGQNAVRGSAFHLLGALTAGDTYNVQLMRRVTGGSGVALKLAVAVIPAA